MLASQRPGGSGRVLAWASKQHRPAPWCLSPDQTRLSACGPLGLSSSLTPSPLSTLLPPLAGYFSPRPTPSYIDPRGGIPRPTSHLPCCLLPRPLPWCFKGQVLWGNTTNPVPALPPTCWPSLRPLPLRAEEPAKYTFCHWAKSGDYGTGRNLRGCWLL